MEYIGQKVANLFIFFDTYKELLLVFVVLIQFLINSVPFPNLNNRMDGSRFDFIFCHLLIFIEMAS